MEDKKKEAHEYMNKAREHITKGNMDDAIVELKKATSIYKKVYETEPRRLAEYYEKLADILSTKFEKSEDSARYYSKSAKKYLESGTKDRAAYCYYMAGEIHDIDLDNLKDAAESFNSALELYLEVDAESNKTAECLEKIANIYYRLDEYDIVKDALIKATGIREKIAPENRATALSMHNAGKLFFDMRMLETSRDYLNKAFRIYGELGDKAKIDEVGEELKMVKAYIGYELV